MAYKDISRTDLGFDPLFYQPRNRCLHFNAKLEYTRREIQIKWYHLSDAIIEVMSNQNNVNGESQACYGSFFKLKYVKTLEKSRV